MVSLFELQDGKIVLTEICFTSKTFKEVMRVFKKNKNYEKTFLILFYMTCPDKTRNPYWEVQEAEKETLIIKECEIDFSLDEPIYEEALIFCRKLYSTPHTRLYESGKIGMDKIADYLKDTQLTKESNDDAKELYMNMMGRLGKLSEDFSKLKKVHDEEVRAALRGGAKMAYDEDQ